MSFTSPFPDVEIPDVSVFEFLFGAVAEDDLGRTALVDPKSGGDDDVCAVDLADRCGGGCVGVAGDRCG